MEAQKNDKTFYCQIQWPRLYNARDATKTKNNDSQIHTYTHTNSTFSSKDENKKYSIFLNFQLVPMMLQ